MTDAIAAHVKLEVAQLVRVPAFSVPTLLFPVLTYLVVAKGVYGDVAPAHGMAGIAGVAVLGTVFFQFGVGIAMQRAFPWESYLRTLPIAPWRRMVARVLSALPFAAAGAALVVAAAVTMDGVALGPTRWLALIVVLLVGAIPFALAGISLGYWLPVRGALPIANIVFFAAAIAGGLWTGPSANADSTAAYIPTRSWAELLWASVDGTGWALRNVGVLAASAAAFGLLAVWGYRRDEGEQFD